MTTGEDFAATRDGRDRPLRIVEAEADSPPVPERPCACCGKSFQPTIRRRLLCKLCFAEDGGGRGMQVGIGADDFAKPEPARTRARFRK